MRFVVRSVVGLLVLAVAGLAGFAYLGDLRPTVTEVAVPVEVDAR